MFRKQEFLTQSRKKKSSSISNYDEIIDKVKGTRCLDNSKNLNAMKHKTQSINWLHKKKERKSKV